MLENCNIGAGRLPNGKLLKFNVFFVLEPFPYSLWHFNQIDGELGRRLYSSISNISYFSSYQPFHNLISALALPRCSKTSETLYYRHDPHLISADKWVGEAAHPF